MFPAKGRAAFVENGTPDHGARMLPGKPRNEIMIEAIFAHPLEKV
jgi:hypothetical protein